MGFLLSDRVSLCLLCSQQALVKGKQSFIDGKDIVVLLLDKVFNDNVELAAAAQRKTCAGNEVFGLLQIQFQGDGESDCCCLGRFVVRVIADFGKQLAVDIGVLVDLGILLAGAVNEAQQSFGESGVQLTEYIVQVVAGNAHRHGGTRRNHKVGG